MLIKQYTSEKSKCNDIVLLKFLPQSCELTRKVWLNTIVIVGSVSSKCYVKYAVTFMRIKIKYFSDVAGTYTHLRNLTRFKNNL